MQELKHKVRQMCRLASRPSFAAGVLFVAAAAIIFSMASLINTVCIIDEGQTLLMHTFQQDPYDILEDNGIVTMSTDVVGFSGISGGYGEINITRSFPVTVTADGRSTTLYVVGGTVSDLLDQLNIEYDSNDLLTPSAEKYVDENENIVLQRVDFVTRVEELVIPHETQVKPTSLVRPGRTVTLQSGQDGLKTLSYIQRTIDGVVEEEQLESEAIVKKPVEEIILVGDDVAVSPLNFDVPTDSNGIPLSYTKVLKNQIATGYNAGGRARGASGMGLSAGYVAVDPTEIPYGTKMYITSPDNSFVYGYAIAADTGTGLMDDVIDVDLYYDTYLESCLNGRKYVNIYLLD